jgi:hypothetical protein
MPVIALAVVLAVAAILALVVRLRGPVPPAPETPVEPQPRPRAVVLAAAVTPPATISGEVEAPRIARPTLVPLSSPTPVPAPPPVRPSGDALDTIDALLAELESTTVRIDGADTLDEGSVTELEGLAERLEEAAAAIAAR